MKLPQVVGRVTMGLDISFSFAWLKDGIATGGGWDVRGGPEGVAHARRIWAYGAHHTYYHVTGGGTHPSPGVSSFQLHFERPKGKECALRLTCSRYDNSWWRPVFISHFASRAVEHLKREKKIRKRKVRCGVGKSWHVN